MNLFLEHYLLLFARKADDIVCFKSMKFRLHRNRFIITFILFVCCCCYGCCFCVDKNWYLFHIAYFSIRISCCCPINLLLTKDQALDQVNFDHLPTTINTSETQKISIKQCQHYGIIEKTEKECHVHGIATSRTFSSKLQRKY